MPPHHRWVDRGGGRQMWSVYRYQCQRSLGLCSNKRTSSSHTSVQCRAKPDQLTACNLAHSNPEAGAHSSHADAWQEMLSKAAGLDVTLTGRPDAVRADPWANRVDRKTHHSC
jgi:hypothetical protein